jgi:hypothetical protein
MVCPYCIYVVFKEKCDVGRAEGVDLVPLFVDVLCLCSADVVLKCKMINDKIDLVYVCGRERDFVKCEAFKKEEYV